MDSGKKAVLHEGVVIFVLLILIAGSAFNQWLVSASTPSRFSESATSPELITFNSMARVLTGVHRIIADRYRPLHALGFKEEELDYYARGKIISDYALSESKPVGAKSSTARDGHDISHDTNLIRAKFILASHFGFEEKAQALYSRLIQRRGRGSLSPIDKIIAQTYHTPDEAYAVKIIEPVTAENAVNKFGWVGNLLVIDRAKQTDKDFAETEKRKVYTEAKQKAIIYISGILAAVFLGALGLLSLLFFLHKQRRQRLSFNFSRSEIAPASSLLVFVLYLAAMNLISLIEPHVLKSVSSEVKLSVNIILFFALVGLTAVPAAFNSSFDQIIISYGLKVKNFAALFRECLIGILAYCAFWPVLLAVLAVYAYLLKLVDADLYSGVHPIVPIILSNAKGETSIWLLLFLAVAAAPLLEEVMFRGVFYAWLRERFNTWKAVILCGFTFAAIHPQGLLGILPLTFIGAGLSFLREWRGTVAAPFAAHACNNGVILSMVMIMR